MAIPSLYHMDAVLTQAYRQFRRLTNSVLAPYQIQANHWMILGIVKRDGHVTAASLAKELNLAPPFVTALLKELASLKYIGFTAVTGDKRKREIRLTTKAAAMLPQIETKLVHSYGETLQAATPTELTSYFKVLHMIRGPEG